MDEETGKLKTDDVIGNPMAAPEGLPSPKLESEEVGGDSQGPHSALQVEEGSSMPHQQTIPLPLYEATVLQTVSPLWLSPRTFDLYRLPFTAEAGGVTVF